MPTNVKLLLTDNVEALGIVGDVVNVRIGYARNYLLPRNLATQPSEEKIKALAAKRIEAEKLVAAQRKAREELIGKLQGVEIKLVKPCNDQGILYGAITQQEIAAELNKLGHAVKPRDVRIMQAIKRVDHYDVHIKLDSDLDATIKLHVEADRPLDIKKAGDTSEEGAVSAASSSSSSLSPIATESEGKGTFGTIKKPEPKADRKGKGDRGDRGDKGGDKGGEKAAEKAADAPEPKAEKKADKKSEGKSEAKGEKKAKAK
ncbi:MAG: 50S ribosomal protein L9 [Phycisphaerales bacterium]|nr:50S ribosomal protein L9 [Phycisphaerales bacterium]